jgi:hypothetical protein
MSRLTDVIDDIGDLVVLARHKAHSRPAGPIGPTLTDAATTIVLDRPVHFSGPDDLPVEVAPGPYAVAVRRDDQLVLTSLEQGRESTLGAQATFHELQPDSPLALSIAGDDEAHHVLLLFPGGGAIQATGRYGAPLSTRGLPLAVPLSSLAEAVMTWSSPAIPVAIPLDRARLLNPYVFPWGTIEPGAAPTGFGPSSRPPNWMSATVATCYPPPAGSYGPNGPGTESGVPPFPPGSEVLRISHPAYLLSVTPVVVDSSLLRSGRTVQLVVTSFVVTIGYPTILSMTWTDVYQQVAPGDGPLTFPGVIVATGRVPTSPPPANSSWGAEVAKRLTGTAGRGAALDLELRVGGLTVATRSMRFNALYPGSPVVF